MREQGIPGFLSTCDNYVFGLYLLAEINIQIVINPRKFFFYFFQVPFYFL